MGKATNTLGIAAFNVKCYSTNGKKGGGSFYKITEVRIENRGVWSVAYLELRGQVTM